MMPVTRFGAVFSARECPQQPSILLPNTDDPGLEAFVKELPALQATSYQAVIQTLPGEAAWFGLPNGHQFLSHRAQVILVGPQGYVAHQTPARAVFAELSPPDKTERVLVFTGPELGAMPLTPFQTQASSDK